MADSWQLIINNIKRKDPNLNFKRALQIPACSFLRSAVHLFLGSSENR